MTNILTNWRTSSAGITVILTSLVHLVFALIHKSLTETDALTTLTTLITGVGLIVSRDSTASDQDKQQHESTVAEMKTQLDATTAAIASGDTTLLKKSQVPSNSGTA